MRLEIQNFRCFRKHTILNFQSGKLTLIKGHSGAGKSTILESIRWCLFGNLRNIYPSGFTPTQNSKTFVSIEINNLKIIRSQSPEQLSVTIQQSEADPLILTQEAAQKYIESSFGNKDVWLSSCFIRQNERCPLMTASSAERLSLLNQILFGSENASVFETPDYYLDKIENELEVISKDITGQTAIYNTYYNKFVTNMGTFENSYNWETMTLETLEEYSQMLENLKNKNVEKTKELIDTSNLENQKNYLQNKLKEFSQYNFDSFKSYDEKTIDEYNTKLNEIQKLLNNSISSKIKYDSLQKELKELNEKLFNIGSENLKISSVDLQRDITLLKSEILELERKGAETKNKEFRKQSLKIQLDSLNTEYSSNLDRLNQYKIQDVTYLTRVLNNVNIYNQLKSLQSKLDALSITTLIEENKIEQQQKDYENKYMNLKYATQICEKYQITVSDVKSKIEAYQKILDFDKLQKVHINNQKNYRMKSEEIARYKSNLMTDFSSYTELMEGLEINEINIKSLIDTINQRLGAPLKCPHCSCTLEYKSGALSIPANEIIDSTVGKARIDKLKELQLIMNKNNMVNSMVVKAESELQSIEPFDESIINQTVYTEAQITWIFNLVSECSKIDTTNIDLTYSISELESKIQELKKCKEYHLIKSEYDKIFKDFDSTLSVTEDVNELKNSILNIPTLQNNVQRLKDNITKINDEYNNIFIIETYEEITNNLNIRKEELKNLENTFNNVINANKIQENINKIFSELLNINVSEITDGFIDDLEAKKIKTQNELLEHKTMLMKYKEYTKIVQDLSLIVITSSSAEIQQVIDDISKNVEYYNDVYNKAYHMYSLANERTELEKIRNQIIQLTNKQTNLNTLKSIIIETTNSALENLVDSINNFTNTILEELFENNMLVEMKLYKEIKTGKNRIKPNVNLVVYYKGETYDINALSGGEKDRISLALTLSLAALSISPIVMLDECMAALNTDLREVCIEEFKKFIEMSNKSIINIEHAGIMGVYDDVVEI